ncbi:MAG: UDP-N-acetylmuramoyl-tripeptide--D-alanyl-D-alanine ligase [Syntrophobacterales bacterium]|nr:UDP-N-acetylmuramoyl-tripeptide--D-alanyl-D-alanine ligase [Syntrophobacterales bacterium]
MNEQVSLVLRVEDVLMATDGHLLKGEAGGVFYGLATDTRKLSGGNLFIPLVGEKFDGHDFLKEAVEAGASGLLLQRGKEDRLSGVGDTVVILVEDTLRALGDIAHFWRGLFTVPVVAVTGSSGKTTTKEMIAGILGDGRTVLKSPGNFNNLVGLPLAIFEMRRSHEAVVLEMGTNRKGEIGRLTEIAAPDVGVITNIGPAHLQGFGSLEAVREEKGDLFRVMANKGMAVINCDDENVRVLARAWDGERITFGFGEEAYVKAGRVTSRGSEGVRFTLRIGELEKDVRLPVVGGHNVRNALAAAAASWVLGESMDSICRGLESFEPLGGRMTVRRLKNEAFLVDDSYNANPVSVSEALKTLRDLKGAHRGIAVLGDMLELGEEAENLHVEIGRIAAETGVDTLILKGTYSRAVASGAMERGLPRERILFMEDPGEIVDKLKGSLQKCDWVLVKGSRKMRLDEVGSFLVDAVGLHEAPSDREGVIFGEEVSKR